MFRVPLGREGAALLALLALVLLVRLWARPQRAQQLGALATTLGWRFDDTLDRSFDDELSHFEVLHSGHARHAEHSMHGTLRGLRMRCGDYSTAHMRARGKLVVQERTRLSYVLVDLPAQQPPVRLLVRREGLWDDLADQLGYDDVDFGNEALFNERFHVEGEDAALLKGPLMELLLRQKNPPTIDCENGRLLLATTADTWSVPEFEANIELAARVAELIVQQRQKPQRQPAP